MNEGDSFFSHAVRYVPPVERKQSNTIYLIKNQFENLCFPNIDTESESHHMLVVGTSRSAKTTSTVKLVSQAPSVIYFDPSREMWKNHIGELGIKKYWKRLILGSPERSVFNIKINAVDLSPMIVKVFTGKDPKLAAIRNALNHFFRLEKSKRTYANLRFIMRKLIAPKLFHESFEPFRILLSKKDNAPSISQFMKGRWLIEVEGTTDDFVQPTFLFSIMGYRKKNKAKLKANEETKTMHICQDECAEWGDARTTASKALTYLAQQGAKLLIMAWFITPKATISKGIRTQIKGLLIFLATKEDCEQISAYFGIPLSDEVFNSQLPNGRQWQPYGCYYASAGLSLYLNSSKVPQRQLTFCKIDNTYQQLFDLEKQHDKMLSVKAFLTDKSFKQLIGLKN